MGSKADTGGTSENSDLATLAGDVVAQVERLIQQQLRLFRSELGREVQRVGGVALGFGAGAALLAAGGTLLPSMLVHLLHRQTRLPLWACYGLMAGSLGAAGAGLLVRACVQARRVELPTLPETTSSLQENLTWLKNQVTSLRP